MGLKDFSCLNRFNQKSFELNVFWKQQQSTWAIAKGGKYLRTVFSDLTNTSSRHFEKKRVKTNLVTLDKVLFKTKGGEL